MDKSLRDAKALLPDNDTLVLQNHFSSLDGLETIDARGDPHTSTPIILTAIVEFNYEDIAIENQVISKFWATHTELEEHVSDTRRKLFTLQENQGDHLRGLVNPKKMLR